MRADLIGQVPPPQPDAGSRPEAVAPTARALAAGRHPALDGVLALVS